MHISLCFLTLIATLAMATPMPGLGKLNNGYNPVTSELSLRSDSATATILFDIDGNEARANFKVPVPGKKAANQRVLALSIQAVNNLGTGKNQTDVVCQGFGVGGEALGKPFDLLTRVVLSGNERIQAMVGEIECRVIPGGLGGKAK
jgi:hypothetical protein